MHRYVEEYRRRLEPPMTKGVRSGDRSRVVRLKFLGRATRKALSARNESVNMTTSGGCDSALGRYHLMQEPTRSEQNSNYGRLQIGGWFLSLS